jgi:hypothetical protein
VFRVSWHPRSGGRRVLGVYYGPQKRVGLLPSGPVERITQHPMPAQAHLRTRAAPVVVDTHSAELIVVGVLLLVLLALVGWWAATRRRRAGRS